MFEVGSQSGAESGLVPAQMRLDQMIPGIGRPVLPGATEAIAGHLASKADWTVCAINCGVARHASPWTRSGGQSLGAVE